MDCTSDIYKQLQAENLEIRVLEILPARGSLVECKLHTVSLNDAPVYSALSYVWGSAGPKVEMILEGYTIMVTENLESAIRHSCYHWAVANPDHESCSFRLWADAICINQDDLNERSLQVQLMRQIYSSAELILSWLGPEDRSLAFGTLNTIADEIKTCEADGPLVFYQLSWLRRYPDLCVKDEVDSASGRNIENASWAAVASFLNASYWKRVWIFQEVVLARRLIMIGPGKSSLDWEVLEAVWQRLQRLRDALNKVSVGSPGFISQTVWSALTTPLLSLYDIQRIATARYLIRRKNSQTEPAAADSNGWIMSTYCEDLAATNPKDHIYGLLGVTGIDIKPDYSTSKTVADVYMEYVVGWLRATRGCRIHEVLYPLSFLTTSGIGLYGQLHGFPSWVPNFPAETSGKVSTTKVATGFADKGLFDSENDRYPYVATDTKSLFVWGIKIDTVICVSEAPNMDTWGDGRMFKFIRDFVSRHSTFILEIPPLQAFSRLVNRDPTSDVDKLVILRALAFLRFLVCSDNGGGDIEIEKVLALGFVQGDFDEQFKKLFFPGTDIQQLGFETGLYSIMNEGLNGPIKEVWSRSILNLAKIHKSWRFFESECGYLGIVPVGTKSGDALCILKDCDVPVVIRKVPEEDHYTFIGTSFTVGLMNGEAIKFAGNRSYLPRWFELQ